MNKHFFLFFIAVFISARSIHPIERMVVIVPSFNNARCYKENLDSIFMQDYPDYRVIYIDDCSTDGTGALVEQYVKTHNLHDKIIVTRNGYNRKALANLWLAVQMIEDTDLVTILDGDDAYAHPRALSRIEQIHREQNIWVSYAQFMNVPEHKARECGIPVKGYAQPTPPDIIASKSYRQYPWSWSGLRSFYAWIFKQIKLEDLLSSSVGYESKFYPICYDNAIFFPLMEMAGTHCAFIDEVLLLRNLDTPLNDFKVNPSLQRTTAMAIRKKAIYPTVTAPIIRAKNNDHADVNVIICATNLERLPECVSNAKSNLAHRAALHVAYNEQDQQKVDEIKAQMQDVQFYPVDQLASAVSDCPYLLITTSDYLFSQTIDLASCAQELEKTYADRFYYDIDASSFTKALPLQFQPAEPINETTFAWLYASGNHFKKPFFSTQHVFLGRSSELYGKNFSSIAQLLSSLSPQKNVSALGLSYINTSVI